jgi:hypothetical protein
MAAAQMITTKYFQRQSVCSSMKPETSGPRTGRMNGAADQINMGLWSTSAATHVKPATAGSEVDGVTHVRTLEFGKTSEIASPETDRKVDPAKTGQEEEDQMHGDVVSCDSHQMGLGFSSGDTVWLTESYWEVAYEVPRRGSGPITRRRGYRPAGLC